MKYSKILKALCYPSESALRGSGGGTFFIWGGANFKNFSNILKFFTELLAAGGGGGGDLKIFSGHKICPS